MLCSCIICSKSCCSCEPCLVSYNSNVSLWSTVSQLYHMSLCYKQRSLLISSYGSLFFFFFPQISHDIFCQFYRRILWVHVPLSPFPFLLQASNMRVPIPAAHRPNKFTAMSPFHPYIHFIRTFWDSKT